MIDYFKNLSLRTKILLIGIGIITVFSIITFAYFVPMFENKIMAEKKSQVRYITQTVTSLCRGLNDDVEKGILDLEEAQETAVSIIKNIRYGPEGKDYLWINDFQPRMIMHPYRTDLDGKDISTFADPQGKRLFVEFARVCRESGSGYVDYMWQWKDDKTRIVPKISYVEAFKPWNWIIGTGIYIEDVRKEMLLLNLKLIAGILVIMAITILIVLLAGKSIANQLKEVIAIARRVSMGDLTAFVKQTHYARCWEEKGCTKEDCPAHGSRNRSCWRIDDTLCGEGKTEYRGDEKISRFCKDCRVYKKAVRNEIDALIESINNMIITFRRIVADIRGMTEDMAKNSDRLTNISRVMEEKTSDQAASIEETTSANEELIASIENVADAADRQARRVSQTSASMEELSGTIQLVGTNSANVSRETKATSAEAQKTEEMLRNTTASINQIAESSKRIVDIVAIITDISDKINLLSLNAAIEAARAGDQGRGFAVVADEISKLADATSSSTKEIEALIANSRRDIETGADLVMRMSGAITQMTHRIESAARLVEEIAVSADEQRRGSDAVMADTGEISTMSDQIAQATSEQKHTSAEILRAITSINESIQEVAGNSQHLLDLAGTINQQSLDLKKLVSRFTV